MAIGNEVKAMTDAYKAVQQDAGNEDALVRLDAAASDLFEAVSKEVQLKTADKMKALLDNLKRKNPPKAEELELLRLWIVGDAQAYMRRELDYDGWVKDMTALANEVSSFGGGDPSLDQLSDLSGSINELCGLLPLIEKHAQQAARIKRFENTLKNLDGDELDFISALISKKLAALPA